MKETVKTIYVKGGWVPWHRRLWRWLTFYKDPTPGDDHSGDGSRERPFKTFTRAMREIPVYVTPGTKYIIAASEVNEGLPPDLGEP